MKQADLIEQLTPIFQDVFDEDDLTLSADLTADDVENWDSLTHVRLIVAIESELDIKLNVTDIADLRNVGQLTEVIAKYL